MSQKLIDFLRRMSGYPGIDTYDPDAVEYAPIEPMTADDWQRFSRDFVEEIGGESVHKTGMTHREFLDYLATGLRVNDTRYNINTYDREIYRGQGDWRVWREHSFDEN
jgi:hypothetical protein